ncbi:MULTISPECIES: elongation factor P 5-aminopentanone reductase [Mediterraneibacter]|uniref:elongation factor P 5-aminopentanone reductase n=1 Tax=Mediterraneibacter TaxID=2316020 RepID=UPI0022E0A2E4|nr:SDR family NAD(P)-dependent oxidoreductase [Mediterraneibacter massiliensis]
MDRKNILITGASRGIGRACAFVFSQAGYHVFLNCRRSLDELEKVRQELEAIGASCTIVPGDVGNPHDVSQIFDKIFKLCPGLDVLINNAGISHIGLLQDMSDTQWEEILHTNLSSVFYCCRAAIPYMIRQKHGKILNISSMWGTSGASCEVAYSATKAGMDGLTKALAKELAPSNIQVNAISCGVIDTHMNALFSTEERLALKEEIPAGRFGAPEEVASLAFSVCSGHPYLTGQIIGLDGGFL